MKDSIFSDYYAPDEPESQYWAALLVDNARYPEGDLIASLGEAGWAWAESYRDRCVGPESFLVLLLFHPKPPDMASTRSARCPASSSQ